MRLVSIIDFFKKRWFEISLVGILFLFAFLQIFLITHENQTIDEGVHIAAGYSYIKTGDFRLNPEHPPLVKELSALPLLFIDPKLPLEHESWKNADQWVFARQFLYESGNDADTILLLSRLPILFLSILLGIIIALWAYELAGKKGSLVSASLYATSPLFLTHGHLVTTDVPLALGVTATSYFFLKVISSRSVKWITFMGLSIAFTVSVKFSGLIIVPLFIFLYMAFWVKQREKTHLNLRHFSLFIGAGFVFSVLLILITTNATINSYSEDIFTGLFHVRNLDILHAEGKISTVFYDVYTNYLSKITFIGYPYFIGLAEFISHLFVGHDSYFLGEYSKTGFFWYFPVAFLIKIRFGVLVLLSLFLATLVKSSYNYKIKNKPLPHFLKEKKNSLILLLGLPIFFIAISMSSHVNIGVRHIIHALPFLYILLGSITLISFSKKRALNTVFTLIIGVTLLSGFVNFPFMMSYFSEIIGGSSQGGKYLLDSNLDWGQNVKYAKKYIDENNIQHVCVAYFGQANFVYEGINAEYLPNNDQIESEGKPNCIALVSAQVIYDPYHTSYSWVAQEKMIKNIGNSIYFFDLQAQ